MRFIIESSLTWSDIMDLKRVFKTNFINTSEGYNYVDISSNDISEYLYNGYIREIDGKWYLRTENDIYYCSVKYD